VVLPVAGLVTSFTPDVGSDGVIGVKSGRTTAAGGCDVMARLETYDGHALLVYAVVLGQRGGDLLGPAGDAALALSASAVAQPIGLSLTAGTVVGRLRWGSSATKLVLHSALQVGESVRTATSAGTTAPGVNYRLFMRPINHRVSPGDIVGYLQVRFDGQTMDVGVSVRRSIATPSLWQRLR
jgi:hypothetical protein